MTTAQRSEEEAAGPASGKDQQFTLQEYFTPGPKRLRRFPHLARVSFGLVWKSARRDLIEVVGLQALGAAGTAGQLFLLRTVLARLVSRSSDFQGLVAPLIELAVLTVAVGASGAVLALRSRLLSLEVARHATDAVIRTAIGVDLVTYEAPGFHDRLQRAQLAAATRPAMMVQELIGLAGASLAVVAIAVTLLILQPLFCVFVLVAYIPVWFVTNRAAGLGYRQTVEQTERLRMRQYLFETLTTKGPAQEVRAFDVGDYLADRQDTIYRGLLDEARAVMYRRMRLALGGHAVTGLLSAGSLAVLVWFVSSGRMSLSTAGSAAGAMVLLSGRLHGVAGSSGGLYENSLYLEDYVEFVAAAPRIAAGRPTGQIARPPRSVAAEAVSFVYPSRAQASLIDASLTLRRDEVVALVGENGSGKTTFAKLLAGLYRPSAGRVTWDGVDVATLDPTEVRRHVAVIFQDFVRYLLPAHDNIALGAHSRFDDRAGVERAATAAGIGDTLVGLRSGYDTILGPAYFGGSDLSGGQWQRVALARLFFRDAPVVILDEPAASLDPRAEAELYANMRSLFSGRAVMLITHRFASARTADRIYVLRDGRIHEEGTHADLLAAGGYYSELFELQARQYRE